MGGIGPIPWTAIDAYAFRHGYEGEGFDYLLKMVRALDDCFVAYMVNRKKDKPNGQPG